ncbi:MAG TPA: ribosome silencing factor [Elusimicrobia bacterium]|jgi:ribosome-associated protein|nr:ribosome silencing factor [Elusimicrobiota bacterium]
MNDNRLKFRKLAAAAARLADDKKASDITIYDIAAKSDAAYFALIATVESQPQMRAVEDEISVGLKRAEGVHALHRDGLLSRTWKVMDYGGLVVHIFEPSARAFYALDRLYDGCAGVEWQAKPAPKPAPKKAPARKAAVKKAPAKKAPAKKAAPRKKK